MRLAPSRAFLTGQSYRWWAFGALAVGIFLTVMDQSGTNIALPRIGEHFGADIPTVQWITLGYILTTSAALMPLGRLSDMIGRKRVYLGGFVVFVVAAALGGAAPSLPLLVMAKVVQGIGSAGVQANGLAMTTDIFPERQRGRAMGLYMTIIGSGAISGPVIGGALVSALGWRAIFFVSALVGLVAIAAGQAVLAGGRPRGAREGLGFDWMGAALSSAALVSFLLGMTMGYRVGWSSPFIIGAFVAAIVLVTAFLAWESRTQDPMLDLRFFRHRVFSMGVGARFLSFLGGSAVYFLMPFYLIQGLGYPAGRAGLFMVPGSLAMAIAAPISGRLSEKVGTRGPAALGMTLSAAAMVTFARLGVDSPPWQVVVGMLLSGSGMGIFSAANTAAIMGSLRRESRGIASAFLNLTRTSANVTGVAMSTTVVTVTMAALGFAPTLAAVADAPEAGVKGAFVLGMGRAFWVSAGLMATAAVVSVLRGEPEDVAPAPAGLAREAEPGPLMRGPGEAGGERH